jgi:hypothetical protein
MIRLFSRRLQFENLEQRFFLMPRPYRMLAFPHSNNCNPFLASGSQSTEVMAQVAIAGQSQ